MPLSFAERSDSIAVDKHLFSQHCFDVFFEPPQSHQTKYPIHMPQQLNRHKNCTKQKFYIYRYFCISMSISTGMSVSVSWSVIIVITAERLYTGCVFDIS